MTRRGIIHGLTIATFFGLLLLPVVLFSGNWNGNQEPRRGEAAFPDAIDQAVLRQFGDWFSDRVGRYRSLRELALDYHLQLLRWPFARSIAFGSHGWLYYSDAGTELAQMSDFRGKLHFQPAQIAQINAKLIRLHAAFAGCGIQFLIVVVPNKESIYGRYFGGDETTVRTRLDGLLEKLDPAVRATILDLRPVLRAAAARHAPLLIFPRNDTHWNDIGGLYSVRAVLDKIAEKSAVPRLDLARLENFEIVVGPYHEGDMPKILLRPELFPDTEVKLRPLIAMPQVKEETHGLFDTDFQSDATGTDVVLMFGDSFGPRLGRLLARHYRTVHLRRWIITSPPVIQLKPRIVVAETVARYLGRLLENLPDADGVCVGR